MICCHIYCVHGGRRSVDRWLAVSGGPALGRYGVIAILAGARETYIFVGPDSEPLYPYASNLLADRMRLTTLESLSVLHRPTCWIARLRQPNDAQINNTVDLYYGAVLPRRMPHHVLILSVRLSVPCLHLGGKRKGLRILNLVGWVPGTQALRAPISRSRGQRSRSRRLIALLAKNPHNFAACCPINLIFGRWRTGN